MHLRLSIVFEKFLKEKNKSEKGNSFAPPAAESRALPEREGEPPRSSRRIFPSIRPSPARALAKRRAGKSEEKSRGAFPPALRSAPIMGAIFSPSRGNRQKGRRFTPFVENFSCVSNRGCPDLPLKSCMRGVPAAHEIFSGSLRF